MKRTTLIITLKRAAIIPLSFLWVFPASSNYSLKSYEFNNAGGGAISSTNYSVEGSSNIGEAPQQSTNYQVNSGLIYTQNADVPPAPTFVNSGNWYDKLLLTLATAGNPTDAKYAIAISTDNFATTNYVQSDNTVGAALGPEDIQTYATWGGGSGFYIIGLTPNTTYKVKVKASQGQYTESAYSAEATAATSAVTLTFDIDVGGASDPGETAAPYAISMGQLTLGGVTTASDRIWVDFDTNATYGGYVYIYDQYGGLKSANLNYTIPAVTSADISSVSEGYGVQIASVTQSSGGPLTKVSPYDGTANAVGVVNTTVNEILSSGGASIVSGRGSFLIKTKIKTTTPAASDYTDTMTLISSATF